MELNFRFCCLGGVDSVERSHPPRDEDIRERNETGGWEKRLVMDRNVTGRWKKRLVLTFPKSPGQLASDFANAVDVLSFTKKYGPLHILGADLLGKFVADGSQAQGAPELPESLRGFEFSEVAWGAEQQKFRSIWETLPKRPAPGSKTVFRSVVRYIEDLIVRPVGFQLPVSGEFRTGPHGLVFRAAELWDLLVLDLLSIQRERLKKCACPTCPAPYFIGRLNAKSCEREECKKWVRNQRKLKWWNANRRGKGASSRRKGRGEHGTQKAR